MTGMNISVITKLNTQNNSLTLSSS